MSTSGDPARREARRTDSGPKDSTRKRWITRRKQRSSAEPLRPLRYRLTRRLIHWIVRPRIAGAVPESLPPTTVYVLPLRSLSDLIVLDIVCAAHGWPDPLGAIGIGETQEKRRFAFLARPAGWLRRNTMQTYSARLMRLTADPQAARADVALLPVQIFWGHTTGREHSLIAQLFSENWAATTRLRRLINLVIARRRIVVRLGTPLKLAEAGNGDANRRFRRCARLLRVRLHGQKLATLGPDFSHRRTLVDQVVKSRQVQAVIERTLADEAPTAPSDQGARWRRTLQALTLAERDSGKRARRLHNRARKAALGIASDMSYPTVVALANLVRAFFRRLYDEVALNGLERLTELAQTHTLVYVPSHRSHADYLLLSLLLFDRGLMLPHIASGDNLNLPVVGGLLRRSGAFFMRRSFHGDPIYAAVFSEYLYQVYRRGHCVEFFPEGGRSRTGRLLPARTGLLSMTLDHAKRGLPRPIALVPVYLGYERLIEGGAYIDELRGGAKRRESFSDIVRGLRFIRQRYGRVDVNIGEPLALDEWRAGQRTNGNAAALGREMLTRVNRSASINPVNLTALTLLCAPQLAMKASDLAAQIDCCLELLRRDAAHQDYRITPLNGAEVVDRLARFGLLSREVEPFGEVIAAEPAAAVLMTWYRNNTAHVLALPSLIAFLMDNRRTPLRTERLERMVATIFPYPAWELHIRFTPGDTSRWIGHLAGCGLIVDSPTGLRPPPADSPESRRLHLLAGIIRQTMERQYIVLSLLTRPGHEAPTRGDLKAQSQRIAHKTARLCGINAPEFFDQRLFDGFIDKLIDDGLVFEQGEGKDRRLGYSPVLDEVMRASVRVIDNDFRHAVLND